MKETQPTGEDNERPAEASQPSAQEAAPAARESGMGATMAIAIVAAVVVFVVVLKWPRGDEATNATNATNAAVSSIASGSAAAPQNPGPPGGWADWNEAQIKWLPYEEGLATAKKEHKPILLVIHTSWCPHCKNYRGVFRDPKVVEQSAQFVMINISSETNQTVARLYAPDGEYIPRTYFLSSEGVLDPTIKIERDRFQYFYDERNPTSLLDGMAAALKKLH